MIGYLIIAFFLGMFSLGVLVYVFIRFGSDYDSHQEQHKKYALQKDGEDK